MAEKVKSDDPKVMRREINRALERIENQSLIGFVNDFRIVNPTKSYTYLDGTDLKFYNHSTGDTKTVTIT